MSEKLAALPLNPDEEADYRWFYGPILPPNPEPTGADTVIARLFATLDAERAYRADLAARVRALPPTMSQHTCWDDHEGGMDAEGQPTLHADGSTCHDRVIGESVDRAAVLAEIEEETR